MASVSEPRPFSFMYCQISIRKNNKARLTNFETVNYVTLDPATLARVFLIPTSIISTICTVRYKKEL